MSTKNLDRELAKIAPFMAPVGFLMSRRWGLKLFHSGTQRARGKHLKGAYNEERRIPSNHGGPDIRIRIFRPARTDAPLPVLVYYHGGGYTVGCPEMALDTIQSFMTARPCVVVAPDYRKALTDPFPAGFNDCYDTLLWATEHAQEIGGRTDGVIIAGHSAGGGMTAAVTLKARDTGDAKIAFQMPIYPMIDDRQTSASSQLDKVPVWNSRTNQLGWASYLRHLHQTGQEVPVYAAPARNSDYSRFPPTITFVGDQEPFLDETVQYVNQLKEAGIPVRFKLFQGAFHGFDQIARKTKIGKAALDFTYDSYAAYYDEYCAT